MSLLSSQLQAFLAVAQVKTVHGAAKELSLTQTGVTQRVRALERSLSTTLFTRSRRGMLLTSEGEVLLRYCIATKDIEGEVLAKIQGAGKRALIQICITGPTSIVRTRVIPQCIPVMKIFRELLIHFKIVDSNLWLDQLKSGGAQIAVMPRYLVPRELESKVLKPEQYVLLGCKDWETRSILDIVKNERLIDFDPMDQMSYEYLRKFKLLDHVRKERYYVNNAEAVATLVQAGMGYGVFTLEFAKRFLERCDVALLNDGKVYDHPMALAWYARTSSPDYWTALMKSIH